MPDRARRRVMFSGQLRFQFGPIHGRGISHKGRRGTQRKNQNNLCDLGRPGLALARRVTCERKFFAKKSWTRFCAPDNNEFPRTPTPYSLLTPDDKTR
jgi:hypothetical protein